MAFLLHLKYIIIVTVCACVVTVSSRICEVRVPGRAWPTPSVLIPVNSTVLMNCTTNLSLPYWLIDVPAAGIGPKSFVDLGGQETFLNENGLYNLQEVSIDGGPSTLRLLINDTELNNQTVVKCIAGNRDILETTLFIYEPSLVTLEAVDTDSVQSSNISWSSLPLLVDQKPNQTYILSVTSPSTEEQRFLLYEPYYLFTAPEGAPRCEVYNFSVTATYDSVGATYTGAGCSLPSQVLSTMLPSLPDLDLLASSVDYSLKMQSGEKVILSVSYQPAKFCQDYPVEKYIVVVESVVSTLHPESKQATSAENSLIVEDLSRDGVYKFSVYAHNSVGNVSTQAREIYTTDVQRVQVLEMGGKDNNTIRIQCDFMLGSNAGGCMVKVLGEFHNTTVNLTRESSDSSEAVAQHKLAYSLSCYDEAYAVDIEADGSLGSVSLPVTLVREGITLPVKCSPNEKAPAIQRGSLQAWIVGILVLIIVLLATIFAVVVAIIMLQLKLKYSTQFPLSELSFPTPVQDGKAEDPLILYAVPDKIKKQSNGANRVRISGDGAENVHTCQEPSTTNDTEKDCGKVTLKSLSTEDEVRQQNGLRSVETEMDVVLRGISPDPDAPPLPPPFNPDIAELAQHPIYDEVHSTKCPPRQPSEVVNGNHLTLESHSKLQNPPVAGHVYQDIILCELSSRTRGTAVQYHAQGDTQLSSLDKNTKQGHVYQDIGELCGALGPPALPPSSQLTSCGHSNAIELLPVLEIGSASSNGANRPPLPPRYPRSHNGTDSTSSNGATPLLPLRCTVSHNSQLPVENKAEAAKPVLESTNTIPGLILSLDHSKSLLPIYDDISEIATKAPMVKTNRPPDLSIVVESDSTNSDDIAHTPELVPTPVYEDISKATDGVRGGTVHLRSPSPEHLSLHQSAEMAEDDDDDDGEVLP